MEENKDNIINKIRNLLRRSAENSGATFAEALACAEIAQRLIEKYRISYELIMAEEPSAKREQIINYLDEFREPFCGIVNPQPWVKSLVHVVGLANHCEAYITKCHYNGGQPFEAFSIVGRPSDIFIARELIWHLLVEITRISARDGKDKDNSWHDDFKLGAVKKIEEKFANRNKDDIEVGGLTSEQVQYGLALIDNRKKEISDFMDGMKFEEGEVKQKAKDSLAFAKGYNSADKISIEKTKEIETKERKMLT